MDNIILKADRLLTLLNTDNTAPLLLYEMDQIVCSLKEIQITKNNDELFEVMFDMYNCASSLLIERYKSKDKKVCMLTNVIQNLLLEAEVFFYTN